MRTVFGERRKVTWRPVSFLIGQAIQHTIESWIGTPYMPGQRMRGVGADCMQQVAGILDDLFQAVTPTEVPRLAQDSAIHSTRAAWPVIKALRDAHHGSMIVRYPVIEPGDVIVTRAMALEGSPRRQAHLLFAGVQPFTAIHALPGVGSHITTLEVTNGILRIYRPRRKDLWAGLS